MDLPLWHIFFSLVSLNNFSAIEQHNYTSHSCLTHNICLLFCVAVETLLRGRHWLYAAAAAPTITITSRGLSALLGDIHFFAFKPGLGGCLYFFAILFYCCHPRFFSSSFRLKLGNVCTFQCRQSERTPFHNTGMLLLHCISLHFKI